jgi:pimeloyl-ACP methyl ester carboxylesterase
VPHSGDRFLDLLPELPQRAQFMYPISRPRPGIVYDPTEYPGTQPPEIAPNMARAANLSVEVMAGLVTEWMDRLGWKRAAVVGESYGGAVAQAMAAQHPERVERLVLIASFTRHPARRLGLVVGSMLRGLPRWAVRYPVKAVARITILRGVPVERRQSYYQRTLAMPLDDIGLRIDALRRFQGRSLGRDEAWPKTLWMWGDRDRLVNAKAESRWLRDHHPSDQVVMVEGAGHVMPASHRGVFASHLGAFLGLGAPAHGSDTGADPPATPVA